MEKVKVFFGERTALRLALAVCLVIFAILAIRRFAGSSNSVIEHIGVHVSGRMSSPEVQFSSERGYSTVTVFARFRGWSTLRPRRRAVW